jgi:hypothetical protein
VSRLARLRRALRLIRVTARGIAHVLASPGRMTVSNDFIHCAECGCVALVGQDGQLKVCPEEFGNVCSRCPALVALRELAAPQLARAIVRRA